MNIIVKLMSGSHLYGTSLPESDGDFRGIYLPTKNECFLQTVKDTIEDKEEEDTTYFSLQRFLNLAQQGQSIAIEMLSCQSWVYPDSSPIWVWQKLRDNRKLFFTKNMHSFLGYAKSQSGKYSSRVDRLNEIEAIIEKLNKFILTNNRCLGDIWDELPESTNAIKTVNERNKNRDKRVYMVCGRELQASITIRYAHEVIQDISYGYGERVRMAKDGQIEWKSFMHAFRVALQAKEIVETGDLIFPLKDAAWLTSLRLGQIDFFKEGLDKKLDDLIVEVQEKMDKSVLPERADPKWSQQFILDTYGNV